MANAFNFTYIWIYYWILFWFRAHCGNHCTNIHIQNIDSSQFLCKEGIQSLDSVFVEFKLDEKNNICFFSYKSSRINSTLLRSLIHKLSITTMNNIERIISVETLIKSVKCLEPVLIFHTITSKTKSIFFSRFHFTSINDN